MDLNNDGHLDILSGCYSAKVQPMAGPVYVLYGKGDGDFAKAVALKTEEGKHLIEREAEGDVTTQRICTEPFAHDWDGDGDLDLLIGNFEGSFVLVMNQGSKSEPLFKGEPTLVKDSEGDLLRIQGVHSAPFLVDWDGDGDVDLISGSSVGGAQIARNTPAKDGTPVFSPFETLLEGPGRHALQGLCAPDATSRPNTSTRVRVVDWNQDGKLDLLLGDSLRYSVPKEGLTLEEAKTQEAELMKKMGAMSQELMALRTELQDADESRAAELQEAMQAKSKEYQALYKTRSEFSQSVSTGHVWVYLRK